MSKYEKYKTLDDLPIVTKVWLPEVTTVRKGVIQIAHGMSETKERYNRAIKVFNEMGYICVISDLRGHGANVEFDKDLGYIGDDGARLMVEDLHAVTVYIKNNYPDLPVILMGHSMGSLLARAYAKKYDEDIDISLKIKKQDVFKFEQIPIPDEFGCKYASEKQNVPDLFGIPATQNYNSFGEYNQNDGYAESVVKPSLHVSNSVETYISDLRDTFAYDFFEDGDYIIVKLHVDYLKHNTAVAFPSVLFVSKELLSIEYTIRSKHTEAEITGIIKAGGNDET